MHCTIVRHVMAVSTCMAKVNFLTFAFYLMNYISVTDFFSFIHFSITFQNITLQFIVFFEANYYYYYCNSSHIWTNQHIFIDVHSYFRNERKYTHLDPIQMCHLYLCSGNRDVILERIYDLSTLHYIRNSPSSWMV